MKTARALLKEDGWIGFYRGFGPRFLNMSFYGTTMIVTYELISMVACLFIYSSLVNWKLLLLLILLLSFFVQRDCQ